MMSFALVLLAKLTVILAAGLIVAAFLRGAAPSLRHLVMLAALACGITLPAAMFLSPRWDVAVLPQLPASAQAVAAGDGQNPASVNASIQTDRQHLAAASETSAPAADVAPAKSSASAWSLAGVIERRSLLIALIWGLGFFIVFAWLTIGRIRLRRIAREAWPLSGADWQSVLENARREAGVTREVRLMSSTVVSTPLTWGSLSPVILLPEDALDWDEEHRRVVLRHELAHVARNDSLVQLVAGFVCAIYWFHPLVWMTERRLRAECERACDDRVVSLGTPAADYASHLLEVARSARAFGAPGFLSVAMARPSQLEGRLLAVLNESRRRVGVSKAARIGAVIVSALLLLPLAAFRPVTKAGQQEPNRAAKVHRPAIVEYGQKPTARSEFKIDKAAGSESGKVVNTYRQGSDTAFQLSAPARNGGTLYLELKTGANVTITSWDRPEVVVRASLGGRDWRDTRVTLQPSDGDVTLTSEFSVSSKNQSTRHSFDIQVPRKFDVRLRSSGGSLSIDNVSGKFTGTTGGGEITIKNANGDVDISTGGGEVNVSDSNLNGSVSTGGGVVHIVRVNGSFSGNSGSGPVIYTGSRDPRYNSGTGVGVGKSATAYISGLDGSASVSASASKSTTSVSTGTGGKAITTYVDDGGVGKGYGYGTGAIRMSTAGGDLSLPAAPDGARVTTGGGRITIGRSGGEVYAQTGGGPINIGPSTGSVAAVTGAGDVNIELKGPGPHNVDVTSGKGQVVIIAPADLNATLELETAYTNNYGEKTRIVSDWPVSITETNTWDDSQGTPRKYIRVRQNIGKGGGGAVIRIRTVNGNIVLKRAG